jgi:hypothetical protein
LRFCLLVSHVDTLLRLVLVIRWFSAVRSVGCTVFLLLISVSLFQFPLFLVFCVCRFVSRLRSIYGFAFGCMRLFAVLISFHVELVVALFTAPFYGSGSRFRCFRTFSRCCVRCRLPLAFVRYVLRCVRSTRLVVAGYVALRVLVVCTFAHVYCVPTHVRCSFVRSHVGCSVYVFHVRLFGLFTLLLFTFVRCGYRVVVRYVAPFRF